MRFRFCRNRPFVEILRAQLLAASSLQCERFLGCPQTLWHKEMGSFDCDGSYSKTAIADKLPIRQRSVGPFIRFLRYIPQGVSHANFRHANLRHSLNSTYIASSLVSQISVIKLICISATDAVAIARVASNSPEDAIGWSFSNFGSIRWPLPEVHETRWSSEHYNDYTDDYELMITLLTPIDYSFCKN